MLNKNFDNCHYGSIWIGKNHFMFPRGCWEVVVDIITIPGYLYYLYYYLDCGVFGKLNKSLQLVLVSFLSFFEILGRRVRYDMITLFIWPFPLSINYNKNNKNICKKTSFRDFRYVVNFIHHSLCNTCVLAITDQFHSTFQSFPRRTDRCNYFFHFGKWLRLNIYARGSSFLLQQIKINAQMA